MPRDPEVRTLIAPLPDENPTIPVEEATAIATALRAKVDELNADIMAARARGIAVMLDIDREDDPDDRFKLDAALVFDL
jgi:hypothetical protein